MNETVEFTNFIDRPITGQQAISLGKYHKIFKKNGVIVRDEFYKCEKLIWMRYYLQLEDNEQDVVANITPLVVEYVEVCTRECTIVHTVVRGRLYKEEVLIEKFNELHDEKGNPICYEYIDMETGQAQFNETEKQLYDENNNVIVYFDYNKDKSLRSIWGQMVYDKNIYRHPGAAFAEQSIFGLDAINKYFPKLLVENPYYLNSNLLPVPENNNAL